jgi:hypothetical protein
MSYPWGKEIQFHVILKNSKELCIRKQKNISKMLSGVSTPHETLLLLLLFID